MLTPITYTERTVGNFLRYQLSAYPFADADLHAQMRALLSLERTRMTPPMKGPYVSLSRSFRQGAAVKDLVRQGVLHPHLAALAPYPLVYGHQERVGQDRVLPLPHHQPVPGASGHGRARGRCGGGRVPHERPGRGPARAAPGPFGRERCRFRHVRGEDAGEDQGRRWSARARRSLEGRLPGGGGEGHPAAADPGRAPPRGARGRGNRCAPRASSPGSS